MDHNQQGGPRRGHFHRGRRGADRRAHERRQPPADQPQQVRGQDHVDVEQIMREIRGRIAQRHGIELSNQQVQELAARRLEAILDPRTIRPALLDQLRKSAGAPTADPMSAPAPEPSYTFEDSTLFESHRAVLRFFRALFNPILKLFFNPNPLIKALNIQSKLNASAAARDQERDRRQTEWNALHYELLQRMVTETSRLSLELQQLSLRVESLAAKVDFNERRVRSIEGAQLSPAANRQSPRPVEPQPAETPGAAAATAGARGTERTASGPVAQTPGEGQRRRRRRRRGRRGSGLPSDEGAAPSAAPFSDAGDGALDDSVQDEGGAGDDDLEDVEVESVRVVEAAVDVMPEAPAVDAAVPAAAPAEDPSQAATADPTPAADRAERSPAPPQDEAGGPPRADG